jgi:hypothetical protein
VPRRPSWLLWPTFAALYVVLTAQQVLSFRLRRRARLHALEQRKLN